MSKTQAIKYLQYLHSLEMSCRCDLTTQDMAIVIEKIRLEFIAVYQDKKSRARLSGGRIHSLPL